MEIKTKLLSGEWVEVSPHTIMRLDAENAGLRDDLATERRSRCCGNCRYYETEARLICSDMSGCWWNRMFSMGHTRMDKEISVEDMQKIVDANEKLVKGMTEEKTYPPVLDACCGTKAFWFDKADSRAVFHDRRNEECPIKPDKSHPSRNLIVRPDVVGDFTDLQFPSDTFALVVFDPPHATFGNSSVMAKTYGTLGGVDWRDMLRRGFAECFRVLRPEGVLVFKWCEWEVPVRDVLALTPEKPLFGHISGRRAQTHWIAFLKPHKNEWRT